EHGDSFARAEHTTQVVESIQTLRRFPTCRWRGGYHSLWCDHRRSARHQLLQLRRVRSDVEDRTRILDVWDTGRARRDQHRDTALPGQPTLPRDGADTLQSVHRGTNLGALTAADTNDVQHPVEPTERALLVVRCLQLDARSRLFARLAPPHHIEAAGQGAQILRLYCHVPIDCGASARPLRCIVDRASKSARLTRPRCLWLCRFRR